MAVDLHRFRHLVAQARATLAHLHHSTGNLDQARHHCLEALTRYTDLDVPEADDVRAHLTALDQALS